MPSTLVRSHSSRTTTGPPRSSSYAEGAARETRQLDRWKEAVADAERVGGHRLLGAGDRTPVRIGGGVDHLLDPSVALRTHDDAPVAERHAVAQESRPVSDRLAQELRRSRAPRASRRTTSRMPGAGPASSTVVTFAP